MNIDLREYINYPVINKNCYSYIRDCFNSILGTKSYLLDLPIAPTMLVLGEAGNSVNITVDFYSSKRNLVLIELSDIIQSCSECDYMTLKFMMQNNKLVKHLNQDEIGGILNLLCDDVFGEELKIIDSPHFNSLISRIDLPMADPKPVTFDSVESFINFMETDERVPFIQSFKLEGVPTLYGRAIASSLIQEDLLGIFKVKYISNDISNILPYEYLVLTYKLYTENSADEEDIKKLLIKNLPPSDIDMALSFISTIKLKEELFR